MTSSPAKFSPDSIAEAMKFAERQWYPHEPEFHAAAIVKEFAKLSEAFAALPAEPPRAAAPLFATPAEAVACLREALDIFAAVAGLHADQAHHLKRALRGLSALGSLEAEVGRLTKMLDVCSDVHGHNVKLKARTVALESELAEAREELDSEKRAHAAHHSADNAARALSALPALPSEPVKP